MNNCQFDLCIKIQCVAELTRKEKWFYKDFDNFIAWIEIQCQTCDDKARKNQNEDLIYALEPFE